jgi:glyoxylase-like metal-dependent hydrolase (beta-lactamase superfamily II)
VIHRINLLIANVFLIQGARPVLVDTGAPNSRPRIERALRGYGVRPNDLALILLTHAHSDHAGSAADLQATWGVPLAVHADDAAMLKRGTNGDFVSMGMEARISRPFVDRRFTGTQADLWLQDGQDLHAYGIPAQVLHTPGHSDGSVSLLLEDGNAIVGDLLRGGYMGGVLLSTRPQQPYFMPRPVNFGLLLNSLQRVLDAGAQRLHVGHGGVLARRDVEQWMNTQRQSAIAEK